MPSNQDGAAAAEAELERLLGYLRETRGFDFTGYKRPSLKRRIARRTEAVGVPGFGAYLDYLEVHPDEFAHLFNTILINVTAFFRDAEAWKYLEEDVLPRLLAAKAPGDPIRVWCAGCASGEESYTIAMCWRARWARSSTSSAPRSTRQTSTRSRSRSRVTAPTVPRMWRPCRPTCWSATSSAPTTATSSAGTCGGR